MSDIAKFEIIKLPRLIAVGKKFRYSYEALNSGDNRLPAFWDKCYAENIFAPLEAQAEYVFNSSHAGVFFDWRQEDKLFSYIIGLLMKEGTTIPPGYSSYEIAATDVALIWANVKDLMETRAAPWDPTGKAIEESGRSCANMPWCADVFHPVRSTTPAENGELILDCYIPLD